MESHIDKISGKTNNVRSCQHVNPERGYAQANVPVMLQEHLGNEQRIAAAYMEKAHVTSH